MLFVPPPDQAARAGILRILLRDRPVAGDVDPDALAKRTSTFTGADLSQANLVNSDAGTAISAAQLAAAAHVTSVNLSGNNLTGFDLQGLRLREADLRLTRDEVAALLRALGANLSADAAAVLADRTALVMVGRALAAHDFRDSALYDPDYRRRFRGEG